MLLSEFTPCGFLELSDTTTDAENIYYAMIGLLGGNYDITDGSREDAWCYAWAMQLAEARLTLEHAGYQIAPPYVTEMMDDREAEYGIVHGPDDTIEVRRQVLAARELIPRGARREAVVDALATLLGSLFIWYRTTKPSEIDVWPATCGAQPMNLQLTTIPRKRISITQPISFGFGAPQTVSYLPANPAEIPLLVGDTLVVEPELIARTETVAVTSVTSTHFTATFNNPHNYGCVATTNVWPMWLSTQRENLIVVDASIAVQPEPRRKINELCARILRGVSTWQIAAATSATTAGPFIIGASPLGATTFGVITFP